MGTYDSKPFDRDKFKAHPFETRERYQDRRLGQHGPDNTDSLKATSAEFNIDSLNDYELMMYLDEMFTKIQGQIKERRGKHELRIKGGVGPNA